MYEHFDALQMACRVNLGIGKLAEAWHYTDAIAALPYFREQRHIGLGRRIEVDAIAGDFDVVVANAELFERLAASGHTGRRQPGHRCVRRGDSARDAR